MMFDKEKFHFLIATVLLSLLTLSCEAKTEAKKTIPPSPEFPIPPYEMVDPGARASYIIENVFSPYEKLDSTTFLTKAVEEQFWVNYFTVAKVASETSFNKSITEIFQKGSSDLKREVIGFVDQWLYEVNSPIYNEKLYVQFMQTADSLGQLSEMDKVVFEVRYGQYLLNLEGTQANDFSFILPDNKKSSLYKTKGNFTLLLFYNPGCGVCKDVLKYIDRSTIFQEAMNKGLTVLCIALNSSEGEWKDHFNEMPANSIVGFDKESQIVNKNLYDIKAFPTIYILGQDKMVISKDPTINETEQFVKMNIL